MTNEKDHSCLTTFFAGQAVGVIMSLVAVIGGLAHRDIEPKIPTNETSNAVVSYDVNKDGLEDLVLPDGTVQIKTRDGNYISLGQMRSNEMEKVRERYEFRKEQVRNQVDNLDYKINTGRYVAGVSK